MKRHHHNPISWLLASSLLIGSAAWAAQPITITNPGFEDPVLTDGQLTNAGDVPGWSAFNSGNIRILNPTSADDLTAQAPEGENVGLVTSSANEDGLSQSLTSTFQADADYALTVKVANTKFTIGFPGYRVQLLAGGTVLNEDDNSQVIAEDAVVTSTVNYTYDAGDAGLVGQPLEIRLLSKGLSNGQEVAFDDVQLTVALANPAADTGGPYEVAIPDGTLSLDGSASLPSDGQTITSWEWDLDNDGTFGDVTGATPAAIDYATLTAAPPTGYGMVEGENTIKLRVTDDSSPTPKTSIAETTVTLAELGTTMTASSNWNGGIWDNGQPTIGLDATIAAGVTATANNAVTPWSGKLTLEENSTLSILSSTNPNPAGMVFEGATEFILKNGSKIIDNFKTMTFTQDFSITGTAGFDCNNNAGNNQNRTFTGTISGGTFYVDGRNHVGYTFNSPNTFANFEARATEAQRYGVGLNAPGAAGLGNVTVSTTNAQSAVLVLGASNVFAESCVLTLNGQGWANSTGGFGPYASGPWVGSSIRIQMNAFDATVSELWIDGIQRPAGAYTGTSGDWIGGTGTLTVLNSPDDSDPPTLAPADIVDNVSGGPIFETETVTYTVTFSEPVDPATVDTDDFENGGTAPATIESVNVNDEVVTVVVSFSGPGTLILRVKAGAVISDLVGNDLDTTTAIADDTTITVDPEVPPTLLSIIDNQNGGPVFESQPFTFFVTFDKALNPATVNADDFENGSGPAITVTNVTAYNNPAVYAVDVVPGGPGSITLQIKAGANLTSAYGTPMDTTSAIPDDTTITVNAGSAPARGTITVDGVAFWSANSSTLNGTFDASGSDKLVVVVTGENGNNSADGNCSGITYDGAPLTQAVDRNPVAASTDTTYNDIWYLDNPGSFHSAGSIVATVNTRGNVTVFGLSGTAPGVGRTAISPQATKSVDLATTFANSIVIASHGMGGNGNTANVTAVDAAAPLVETSATAQASGSPSPWDGHVTATTFDSSSPENLTTSTTRPAGTDIYAFTGGNLVGSHTIAAEFLAAEVGTGSPYDTWAAVNAPSGGPNDDFDGDGVSNGVEFVLGGTISTNDLGLLPAVATSGGDMTFTFVRDQDSVDASVGVVIEVGTDLSTWPDVYTVGADTAGSTAGVTVTDNLDGTDTITLTVTQAPDAKKFARLKVEIAP